MKESEVIEFIRYEYRFHKNHKIRQINMKDQTFKVNIGDCMGMADIEFGKQLKREIKLREIGIK